MYIVAFFVIWLIFSAAIVFLFTFGGKKEIYVSGLNKWILGFGLAMQMLSFLFIFLEVKSSFLVGISFDFIVLGDVFACIALFYSYLKTRSA